MKDKVSRQHRYFIPEKYSEDEQVFRKARILVNTSFITAAFALSFLYLAITFGQTMAASGLVLCSLGFLSIPWLLKWGLNRGICANIFVALTFASTLWDIYWWQGMASPEFWWLCMTPVVAIFLNTPRSAWVWLVLTIIAVMVIGILNIQGHYFESNMKPEYLNWALFTSNLGLVSLMLLIAMVMEKAYITSMRKLSEKNEIIESEKKRGDDLLRNILPEEVMNELKMTGKTKAHNYELVTVLFADFKDFTILAEEMSPEELVSGIDEYFEYFDYIVEQRKVEKIKTVGDAYICASGIPELNSNNPTLIVEVALDIITAVEYLKKKRMAEGKQYFDIRVGVHSGPLVAGVVGFKKFAYDIWGDTVNTAARMQQSGEPGRVNISGTTYELIKDHFNCKYRGKLEAKHKGFIDMYFVDSEHEDVPELSAEMV